MSEADIIQALRESAREVSKRRSSTSFATIRRYVLYVADILDIIVNIQRDRRWGPYD